MSWTDLKKVSWSKDKNPGEKTLSFSLAKLIVFTKRVKENLIKRTTAKKFATKRLQGPGLKKKAMENGMHYKNLFKRGEDTM